MKINRWATFAAGCTIMASSGLSYSFSILSPGVKELFGFSDAQIGLLASVVTSGAYFAIFGGMLYDRLAHRHNLGPRVVIWVGCAVMLLGYGGMWLQARGLIAYSFRRMLLCGFLAGNAGTFWDVSVLVTNVRNFPNDRGSVLGIAKSFLGMSASIYTTIYWALFTPASSSPPPSDTLATSSVGAATVHALQPAMHGDQGMEASAISSAGLSAPPGSVGESAARFMGCLALVPAGLNLIASSFVNHVPVDYHEHELTPLHPEHKERAKQSPFSCLWWCLAPFRIEKATRFMGMYSLVGLLVVFQAAVAIYRGKHQEGREVQEVQMAILLCLLSLLLLLPISTGPLAVASLRRAWRGYHGQHHSHEAEGSSATSSSPLPPGAVSLPQDTGHSISPCTEAPQIAATSSHPEQPTTQIRSQHATYTPAGVPVNATTDQGADQSAAQHCGASHGWYRGSSAYTVGVAGDGVGGCGQGGMIAQGMGSEEEGPEEWHKEAPPAADLKLGQAVSQPSFAVLFCEFLASSGSGLTYLNNLASIVVSLGGPVGGQVVFVSLFSVANACGRLLFGHVSEHYLHALGVPRTAFLALASVLSLSTTVALGAGAPLKTYYVIALLMGFSFGGHWSIIPAVASDLYGLRNFAALYAVLHFAPAIASFAFASWLAGLVESATAHRQHHPLPSSLLQHNSALPTTLEPSLSAVDSGSEGLGSTMRSLAAFVSDGAFLSSGGEPPFQECRGVQCYAPTFRVLAVVHVVSLCGVAWLVKSTQPHYALIVSGRKQQERERERQSEEQRARAQSGAVPQQPVDV